MRLLLAALLAAPSPSFAAVIERLSLMETGAPTPAFAAPRTALASTALAPSLAAAALLLAAPASSAYLKINMPLAAAPIAAVPVRAAVPLAALGAVIAAPAVAHRPAAAAPALAAVFDGSLSAAAAPEPVQPPDSAKTPAPLAPAAPTAASRLKAAVPNLLTFSNMSSGLLAVLLAADGRFAAAGLLILLANVFDALDGRAARALKIDNPLGTDLDSLADAVSFGAAPAILIFKAALQPAFGWWGFPIAASFAAAGVYRLARFNVGAHAEKAAGAPAKKSDSFTGLPIPGGAGVIVALTLALAALPAAAATPVAAAATLLAAAAMISRLPYPSFKSGGAKGLIAPAALGLAAAAPLALLGAPTIIPAAVFGLYLAAGPLKALTQR